jgi:hypothetical protein
VLFESGGGFCEKRTIPLVLPDLTIEELGPPLSLLQLRRINRSGLEAMTHDIANLAGMRTPSRFPGMDEVLERITDFVHLRQEDEEATELSTDAGDVEDHVIEEPDPELELIVDALRSRANALIIRSIQRHQALFEIPPEDELATLSMLELHDLAGAVGAETPWGALGIGSSIPSAGAPEWKKLNARNTMERQREWLDDFERSLEPG